jgi:hypothetical protein
MFMKKNLFYSLTVIGILLFASCQKSADKIIGGGSGSDSWAITEDCDLTGTAGPYNVTLEDDPSDDYKFKIKGLYETPAAVTICTFSETDDYKFTASRQALTADMDIEITTATVASDYNSFTFTYSIYDSAGDILIETCNATANRN